VFPIINDPLLTFPQHASEFIEARYIALGAAAVDDGVGIGEKFRHVYRNPTQLGDAVAAVLPLRLAQYVVEEPRGNFPGQQFLPLQALGTVVIQPRPGLPEFLQRLFLPSLGVVPQLTAVEVQHGVVNHPQTGEQLRGVGGQLQGDLVDVVVNTHGGNPEPERRAGDGQDNKAQGTHN